MMGLMLESTEKSLTETFEEPIISLWQTSVNAVCKLLLFDLCVFDVFLHGDVKKGGLGSLILTFIQLSTLKRCTNP